MLQNRPQAPLTDTSPLPSAQSPSPENQPASRLALGGGARKYLGVFVVLGLIAIYEKIAPDDFKLSAVFGRFEGNTESAALRAQVDGLKIKLEAEKAAEEKMQNEVNAYKQKLEIEQQNTINKYAKELEVKKQNEIDAYKLTLDAQLESYKNQINLVSQKAIDTNRLNLERRNKMTDALLTPITKALEEKYRISIYGMFGSPDDVTKYAGIIDDLVQKVTAQVQLSLNGVENGEAQRACQQNIVIGGFAGTTQQPMTTKTAVSPPPQDKTPYQHGAEDRTNWEKWFAGLSVGDYRSGAFYWTAHRNTTPRGSCVNARNESYGEFTRGCLEAKKFLDQIDQWRADADYKAGWNSYTPPAKSQPRQCSVIGIKPDDPDGGLVIRQTAARGAKPVGVIPYDGRGILNENCACDGEGNAKCHVRYNGVDGWVAGQFLFPG
jgi:hypothetical protein